MKTTSHNYICKIMLALLATALTSFVSADVYAETQFCNVTIDFSTHGQGPLDPSFYRRDGITFSEQGGGLFVAFIQGDDALSSEPIGGQSGPIKGTLIPPIIGLSVRLAPAAQGTAEYTLTTFDPSGRSIASNSVVVTQDTGDPQTGPAGYFTINMTNMSRKAKSFVLANRFIRSSFDNTVVPFGVSENYSYSNRARLLIDLAHTRSSTANRMHPRFS